MSQNKVLIFLILLGFIGISVAQVDTAWVRRYNDSINGPDTAKAMAIDDLGNVYVTGNVVGDTTGTDWATIKYNPNGDQVWVRNYITPGDTNEGANAIAVGNSGDIYVTGYTMGSNLGDFLTIKYNPAGETVWTQRLDGPEEGLDVAVSIFVDNAENVYVAGYTEGAAISDYDFMVIKYDFMGYQQWARIYNSALLGRDEAKKIAVDFLGNVYITGTSNTVGSANYDYKTVSYRANGDFRWAKNYNGPADSTDIANDLVLDDSGYVYVIGASIGVGTSFDYATIKYTPLGETVWVRRYNGPPGNSEDEGFGIAVDNWSNVYVTGASVGIGSSYDYATIKYNYLGVQQWAARYNGPANSSDWAKGGIKADAQGNIYLTGYSTGIGTGFDYATIKYNPAGDTQWVARYNGPANDTDQTRAITVDGYGNVYVTGYSKGIGTSMDWATIKYIQPGYGVRDVATIAIVSPPPVVTPNAAVVPACSVYNYGDSTETYLVRMEIGSFYEDTVRVIGHAPGSYRYLTFATWNATQLGMHVVTCTTELLVDGIKRNDEKLSTVVVGTVDVEVYRILAPTGTVDTLPVIPRARIRNNSSVSLDIPVTFKIFKDTLIYFDSRIVSLSGNGALYDVPFDTFYIHGADTGNYTTEAAVSVLGDQNVSNDIQAGAFTVVVYPGGPGWQAMAPIPLGSSLKRPKSGSGMIGMRDNIYFLKASNTPDFHIYTPDGGLGTWSSLIVPLGTKETGDGKNPKKGAAITAYQQDRTIFILRGNNTVGFWKYQTDTIGGLIPGWAKLRNIPEGLKKPKDGSGMAAFRQQGDGYIFTMKGSKTDEFYIYGIEGDTWHKISSPPPGPSGKIGYKKGSCIAYDGDFMYVLKGNYGDFFKYSVDGDTWHQLRRYDYKIFINRDGKKKKVKDGSGLVYYNENLYLLKGGNTLEFWLYQIAADSWIQMNPATTWDIPLGGGKRVKDGGCLTIHDEYFYAAKGKNTDEFYRHTLPIVTLVSVRPTNEGTQEEKSAINGFKLVIAPNPAIKVMTVKYNLPVASPVSIKLYNITGSLVKSCSNTAKEGIWTIDAKSIPAGVYVLRFNSGLVNVNRKIVLEK